LGEKRKPQYLDKILGLKEKNQPITKGGSSTDLNAVEGEQLWDFSIIRKFKNMFNGRPVNNAIFLGGLVQVFMP